MLLLMLPLQPGSAGDPVIFIAKVGTKVPDSFALSQNYPNPFGPSTEISFDLPVAAHTTLTVLDLKGKAIAYLTNKHLDAGAYIATWNGKNRRGEDIPSGIYTYTLQAGDFSSSRKMMLLR